MLSFSLFEVFIIKLCVVSSVSYSWYITQGLLGEAFLLSKLLFLFLDCSFYLFVLFYELILPLVCILGVQKDFINFWLVIYKIRLSSSLIFPDPELPTISILYGWLRIRAECGWYTCIFSPNTSSKLIIVINYLFSDVLSSLGFPFNFYKPFFGKKLWSITYFF